MADPIPTQSITFYQLL